MAKHRHVQNTSKGNNTGYVPELAGRKSYDSEHPVFKGTGAYVNTVLATNTYSVILTDFSGEDKPHNNLPPLYGVYKFRRIK